MDWKITDGKPIWSQLQEQLTLRIIAGSYPPGSRLPSVRELAAEAGVNPNTMQRALSALEGTGLVETHRTAGRVVAVNHEALNAERKRLAELLIEKYLHEMQTLGFSETEAKQMVSEG